MSRPCGTGKKIYIDGVQMTLDEVREMFEFNDNAATIKALKRRLRGYSYKGGPKPRLANYEVRYED